jgi:hypothetical protein
VAILFGIISTRDGFASVRSKIANVLYTVRCCSVRCLQRIFVLKSAEDSGPYSGARKIGSGCLLTFRHRFKRSRTGGQQTLHGWDEVIGVGDDFVDGALLLQQPGAPFVTKFPAGGMWPRARVVGGNCFFGSEKFGRDR